MDTVTQVVLGAAVGEAVLGKKVGRKATFWGAVCGTLPDLDVLVPFGGPVADFTYHRSFSHSLLMMALMTPLLVWLIRILHPREAHHRSGWYALVYLALATHALLDSCTIYGTQIFWPLTEYPMSWGTLFIIDPAFTLPLMLGLVAAFLLRKPHGRGHFINNVTLAISTVYLLWSFGARFHAQQVAERSLAQQGIEYRQMVTLASPFNTLLWRFVVMQDEGYLVGWHSLLDPVDHVRFTFHPSAPDLLKGLETHWPVQRLQWFTKGFYRVEAENHEILLTDLRMGLEDGYVFRFKVGELGNPHSRPAADEMRRQYRDLAEVKKVLRRITDPSVTLD